MFTSFEVDKDDWNKFSSKVSKERGNRELGNALNIFIRAYLKGLINLKDLEEKLKSI